MSVTDENRILHVLHVRRCASGQTLRLRLLDQPNFLLHRKPLCYLKLVFISCITSYILSDCVAWESRCCRTSIRSCSQAQSSAIWIGVAQGHIAWLWVQEGYWRIPQHLPHLNMLGVPQPNQTTWNNKYSIWQHCFPIPMRLYFYLSWLQYA